MPILRTTQKAERVLTFLLALDDDRIAAPLVARGLAESDVEEGFQLLRALVRRDLAAVRAPGAQADALAELERFRKETLGVAAATLRRRLPEAHEFLLASLPEPAIIAVMSFLDRYDRLTLSKRQRGLGAVGVEAKAWLARRGLGDDAVLAVRTALACAQGRVDEREEAPAVHAAAREEAEKRLWAYYQEWSHIGRSAITDQNLLRKMGLRRDADGA